MKSNNGFDICNLGGKTGIFFSLKMSEVRLQISVTSGHVIDDVILMTLIYNLFLYL